MTVAGQVIGNIIGRESVDIQASGKLEGDVKAPRVAVADGAFFKGRVEMTSEQPKAAQPDPKTDPKPAAEPATKSTAQPSKDSQSSKADPAKSADSKPAAGAVGGTPRDSAQASESAK